MIRGGVAEATTNAVVVEAEGIIFEAEAATAEAGDTGVIIDTIITLVTDRLINIIIITRQIIIRVGVPIESRAFVGHAESLVIGRGNVARTKIKRRKGRPSAS